MERSLFYLPKIRFNHYSYVTVGAGFSFFTWCHGIPNSIAKFGGLVLRGRFDCVEGK